MDDNERGKNSMREEGQNDQDDDFILPMEEQLENANSQVKDLQDYIKKKSLEDIKNGQLRQDVYLKNIKAL
jgi:hypothetical protein